MKTIYINKSDAPVSIVTDPTTTGGNEVIIEADDALGVSVVGAQRYFEVTAPIPVDRRILGRAITQTVYALGALNDIEKEVKRATYHLNFNKGAYGSKRKKR
jgi:hypothetical protein